MAWRKKDKWLIFTILFITFYTLLFTFLLILRYKSFFSYEWEDEAALHQMVWNTAHGRWFYTSIGVENQYFFMGHFRPIIFLQSIIYRISPHIYNLFLMISITLSIGALPLFLIARRMLRNSLSAFIISLSYLLYSPLHNINFFGTDSVILAVPFFFFLLLIVENNFYQSNSYKLYIFILLCLLALMCKENVGFTIIFLSIYLFIIGNKRPAFFCFIFATIWLLITIPFTQRLNVPQGYSLARSLEYSSFKELVSTFFNRPTYLVLQGLSFNHLQYLFKVLMPVAFLPLLSLVGYISMPALIQLILINGVIGYTKVDILSLALPFLFVGMTQSMGNISKFISRKISLKDTDITLIIATFVLILNILNLFGNNILGNIPENAVIYDRRFINVKNIFDPIFYIMDEEDKTAWSFVSMIPKGASVSATGDLLPALSNRANLLELFNENYDYLNAEYILFHTRYVGFGAGDYTKMDNSKMYRLINEMKVNSRWLILREENNFILFKRKRGFN